MPVQTEGWQDFGLAGLVIAALFAVIVFLIREHNAERREWTHAYLDQGNKSDLRQAETNSVIRELASVIRESNSRYRRDD